MRNGSEKLKWVDTLVRQCGEKPDDELHFVFAFGIRHSSLIFLIKISANLFCMKHLFCSSKHETDTF